MKTEISNEIILQAHKEASDKWKGIIEKECPELFPKKFKVGDWVFMGGRIFRIEEISENAYAREFIGDSMSGWVFSCLRLATKEEIESHLIKQWESKGGKDGVEYMSPNGLYKRTCTYPLHIDVDNELVDSKNLMLTNNGKWATILEEPKVIELTLEERVAKLEEKLSK